MFNVCMCCLVLMLRFSLLVGCAQVLNACKAGDFDALVRLVEVEGADVNTRDDVSSGWIFVFVVREVAASLWCLCARCCLCQYGWRTALMYAAEHRHAAIFEYLVWKGADVNAKDRVRILKNTM